MAISAREEKNEMTSYIPTGRYWQIPSNKVRKGVTVQAHDDGMDSRFGATLSQGASRLFLMPEDLRVLAGLLTSIADDLEAS